MSRENPRPIAPAFDDLRHLRRHTPGGWLIEHPLLRHPAPPPQYPAALPAGYISTVTLCRRFGLKNWQVRSACRNIRKITVHIPGQRPVNTYPERLAIARLQKLVTDRKNPCSPPVGYLSPAEAMSRLICSNTTLVRMRRRGQLRTVQGRIASNGNTIFFYSAEDVEHCRQLLFDRRTRILR